MYPISNEVKALFEAEQRKVLRITGTDKNGTTITITDNDVITNTFAIDRYSCNSEKLEIGTAVAAQMSLRLENGNGRFNSIIFEGAELFAEIGITDWESMTIEPWTDNNGDYITDNYGDIIYFMSGSVPMSWVPLGLFTPDVQPRRMTTISLTCMDRMTRFDKIVDATALDFPMTVVELVGLVCGICDVPFNQSLSEFPNYNYSIAALPNLSTDITYRNLIQWCAGLMGTNAWIDWEGYLRFSWYNNSTEYVSMIDNRYNSDLYENAITITGVEFTDTDENKTVYLAGTDDYTIDVSDNAFINGNNAATVLAGIYSAVQSFVYTPFTASVIAAPYLWPMDRVTFTDKAGNTHVSLLTNVNFGVNGTTALMAVGMTDQVNAVTVGGSGFTKVQIQELRNIQRVTSDNLKNAVDAATALITGADGGHVRFMYDSNGELTEILIMDTDDITTATKVWRWNSGGLGYSSNGYAGPYTLAMTQNGAIVADFITTGTLNAELLNVINLNANSINAGMLNADRVDFNSPGIHYNVPNENDASTLLDGQTVSGGWIVNTSGTGYIKLIQCDYAVPLRGMTVSVTFTYNVWRDGSQTMQNDGEDCWWYIDDAAEIEVQAGWFHIPETQNPFTHSFTVPDDANSFLIRVNCTGVKAISVSLSGTVVPTDSIKFTYAGLDVGKFMLDRDGNIITEGSSIFKGDASCTNLSVGNLKMSTPLPIASGGTGASTVAGARTNLGISTFAGSDSYNGPANTVKGAYTSNGGQENPNYFGKNKVGFLMMNTTVNNNSQYKDWIIMDCYSGNDVGGGVAFGVNRQSLGAYIMRSAAARSSWAEEAELIGTHNYTSYCPTKTGSGASGTWGISITGNAATATKLSTARSINGTSFDGSAAITTANWGTARNITIKDATSTNAGTAVSVNGSAAITLLLPSTIKASITGNCSGSAGSVAAGNISGTVAIGKGGTGATTAANARKNLSILSGSTVVNFSNGLGTIAFSTVGVSSKPTAFVATASSQSCIMRYDYDDTNASAGPIKLYCIQANGVGYSGNVRFSWICIP